MEFFFYPPPGPFIGGYQPYAPYTRIPTSGSAPAFTPANKGVNPAILVSWVDSPIAIISRSSIFINAAVPDNPPIRGAPIGLSVLNSWIPPDPLPTLPQYRPPTSGPAPSNPPRIGARVPLSILNAWIPPDPLPILPQLKLPPNAPTVNNPPIIGAKTPLSVLQWYQPEVAQPQIAVRVSPQIPIPPVLKGTGLTRISTVLLSTTVSTVSTIGP